MAAQQWETKDLQEEPDYLAPDGSEIRLLPSFERGGSRIARYIRERPRRLSCTGPWRRFGTSSME